MNFTVKRLTIKILSSTLHHKSYFMHLNSSFNEKKNDKSLLSLHI